MIDTIYIEKAVENHPQTRRILEKANRAELISIDRYSEVFNTRAQNFRLQKKNPSLILARKHEKHVLQAPPDYNIGGRHNYYFSHMMNCIYDCRYCFLQGMYQSAHYVVFVNYDEFFDGITQTAKFYQQEPCWFFSGYDCDSLALEPMTGFMDSCLSHFESLNTEAQGISNAHLEIRTKSTQIRSLLRREPVPNCVVAYSLSPEPIVAAIEHKTPSLAKRLEALQQLQKAGWNIGLRFDPLVAASNFDSLYSSLFNQVFEYLDPAKIHSVSLGTFRLPKPFFKKLIRLYPDEPMLSVEMNTEKGLVSYPHEEETTMMSFCENILLQHIDRSQYFPCIEPVSPAQILTT